MDDDANDTQTVKVNQITGLPSGSDTRMREIEDFLYEYRAQMEKLARRLAYKFRMMHQLSEVEATVFATAFDILNTSGDREVGNFTALLVVSARNELNRMRDEDSSSGLTGLKGQTRRRRSMESKREAFAKLNGHDPSDDELVDFHNVEVRRSQAHPEKHGQLGTAEDLRPVVASEMTDVTGANPDDGVLSTIMCRDLVETIVARCCEVDADLGKVAEVWLGLQDEGLGPVITAPKVIAEHTGVSIRRINGHVARAQAIAQDIVLERISDAAA